MVFTFYLVFFFVFIKNKSPEDTDCLEACDAVFVKTHNIFIQHLWLLTSSQPSSTDFSAVTSPYGNWRPFPAWFKRIDIYQNVYHLAWLSDHHMLSNQVPKNHLFFKNKSSLRDLGVCQAETLLYCSIKMLIFLI